MSDQKLLRWLLCNICVTNDHGYVPLVASISWSFPPSWLITGFVTRLTRQVTLVEQELLTLPEHLSSPPNFSGVRVSQSLVLFVCFEDGCLSFCPFNCYHSWWKLFIRNHLLLFINLLVQMHHNIPNLHFQKIQISPY
jgi:hypothetical protein